jgi:hypothetical protein
MPFASGKYYNETRAGNCFILSTAVGGVATPISTGTAATFGLWNTNPNKLAVLQTLNFGFTSGTIALGEVGLVDISATAVATGSNITAFTDSVLGTTLRNGIIGGGANSTMRSTPSAATVVANTACYWTGMSHEGATGVGPGAVMSHDFNGQVIVPYGRFVFVCGSIAQTGLFTMSLTWQEVDA